MSKSPARVRTTPSHPTPDYSAIESRYAAAARARSTAAPWRGSPPTPSWRPNGYNNPRVDDRGATPSPEPRRSVTPEPRRRAPPRATPVKPSSATTPAAAGIEPSTSSGSPMRFRSTPEGKNGATPSAAYVEAAENMRRSLRRLGAASEAADLVLMRSAAAVVAAEETKKAADRGGVEATFIDAFRSAEKKGDQTRGTKGDGTDCPTAEDTVAWVKASSSPAASPEPANDFERQFLAAYRKYASSPSPVAARDSAAKKPAPVERTPPSARANEPSRTSGETPRNAEKRREATRSEARPGAGPGAGAARPGSSSAEAARLRASLARLNAATVAKDGEYTPPPTTTTTTTTDVDDATESPAVRLFSEKMSAPSPEKRRAGVTTPERAGARTPAAIAPDSDSDDDRLLGLDENADIRRFLGTPRGAPPGGKRREATGAPLASLGANASTSRGAEERAEDAKTLLPAPVAKTCQLDKDKRKREDREADDFEALLASHETERAPGSQPARMRSSFETKAHVTARRPPVTKPAPAPALPVSRIRGRSSLLTKPPAASAVERPAPSSATTFKQRTRGAFGLAPGSVLSRSRAEYEAEKAAKARREAEECTFSPKTIGTPAYLKKKRAAGAGSGKKREVRYAELPIRGSAWR